MFTRKDYMAHKCTHQEYYMQFVTDKTFVYLERYIGEERLLKSKDESFNNIPLYMWDCLPYAYNKEALSQAGDLFTLGSHVCIYKAAAKFYLGMHTESDRSN